MRPNDLARPWFALVDWYCFVGRRRDGGLTWNAYTDDEDPVTTSSWSACFSRSKMTSHASMVANQRPSVTGTPITHTGRSAVHKSGEIAGSEKTEALFSISGAHMVCTSVVLSSSPARRLSFAEAGRSEPDWRVVFSFAPNSILGSANGWK